MRTWLDRQEERLERRLQLLRGQWTHWRGAHTGRRFGVGQGVRILYPSCLHTGDDVTLSDSSYLHCLSERGVRLGSFSSIDRNLWLHCGADLQQGYFELGEHSYIGCNAVMGAGGGIRIGQHVLIGQSVHIHAETHNFADAQRRIDEQGVTYQAVAIEDDVWIGSCVMILAGVTIGRGAVIGGGAVVTTSVPPYGIAVGVPARVIGQRGATA
jgi:acetyltransferase-like isoleucine patch superfamily enzyme